MYDLNSCIVFSTNRAAKKMADAFNERLIALGISRVKWTALYFLAKYPGISQRELALYMHIKSSTVARLLDRMDKEGLVERYKNTSDRRVSIVKLSESGQELLDKLLPEGKRFSTTLSQGISDQDLDQYNKTLEQMLSNISLGK